MKRIIIAIDGHSSCGKSTMAKALAKKIGYTYVDTGAMYRAVTLFAIQHGMFAENVIDTESLQKSIHDIEITFKTIEGRQHTFLNGKDVENEIRGMEVSGKVSPISAIGFVREELVKLQRKMGAGGGVVMDGRDIGTVVYPDAELKIFVTASDEVRARRRYDELIAKGSNADFDDVLKNVRERDYIDSHREISPLRQAEDALLLDNSNMTIEDQDGWLMNRYLEATGQKQTNVQG